MQLIGVDEAGRGALLGPLVVASLSIPASDERLLIEAGVDDSKRLNHARRTELDAFIRSQCEQRGWTFSVQVCAAADIDITMQTETLNILECHLFAHSIDALTLTDDNIRLQLDACDVDTSRFSDRVLGLVGREKTGWDVISEHGADERYPCVAGASILAKVARDKAVAEIDKNLEIMIGSGYPSDPTTQTALKSLLYSDGPHQSLRRGWAPVASAWREIYGRTIPPRHPSEGSLHIGGQTSLNRFGAEIE